MMVILLLCVVTVKTIKFVSKTAPNKICDIKDKECQARLQTQIDTYEDMFFARLTARFDKTKDQIAADFDNGGVVFADRINTVSPTYAEEIQTPEFGCGLDGLLRHRQNRLSGILNGVDKNWDPAHDPALIKNYSLRDPKGKQDNKKALRQELHLLESRQTPLLAFIGRLVEQKGVDMLLEILPEIVKLPAQITFLGSGEKRYEQALQQLAQRYSEQIAVRIGFDEALAHRIEAGADMFLMPSRFEPCGLNQMYSLRYGTLPIVHRVGGLADTVVDSTPATLKDSTATGVVFDRADSFVLLEAI